MGTEKGSQIYAGRAYKTDRQGNTVISKLNSTSLRSLASKTGGQYFEINESLSDEINILLSKSGFHGVEFKKDLNGKIRMFRAVKA